MESIHSLVHSVESGADYIHPSTSEKPTTRLIKNIFEWYCRLFLFRIYCPVAAMGSEHLPSGSFLFCSNHCSHMDSVALMVAAQRPFDNFGMMAAMDYFFENKTRKLFLNQFMNLIPIKRQPTMREVVQTIVSCRHFIRDNSKGIIIFPEGTRSLDGHILPFKKGAAMIAIELGIPIVPAYIKGTREAMPKGRGVISPHKIFVNIGDAISPEPFAASARNGRFNKSYRYLTHDLEKRVQYLKEAAGCEN